MDHLFLVTSTVVLIIIIAGQVLDMLGQEIIPTQREIVDTPNWDDHVEQALYLANENWRKDRV